MDDVAAAVPAPSVRRALRIAAVIALSGGLLGLLALVVAVVSVTTGDDGAVAWLFAALAFATLACRFAWARVESAWASSSQRVRYHYIRKSQPFKCVLSVCAFCTLLAPIVTVGALVWLGMRLADDATGWLWLAIPVIVGAGLAAMSAALTVAFDGSRSSFHTFDFARAVIDRDIQHELEGGGSPDWNSFWLQRISYYLGDPPVDRPGSDCVDHIIAARAAAGLPPLEGI